MICMARYGRGGNGDIGDSGHTGTQNIERPTKRRWPNFRNIRPNDVPKHSLAEGGEAVALGQCIGIEIESAGRNAIHSALSGLQRPAFTSKYNNRFKSNGNSLQAQSISV